MISPSDACCRQAQVELGLFFRSAELWPFRRQDRTKAEYVGVIRAKRRSTSRSRLATYVTVAANNAIARHTFAGRGRGGRQAEFTEDGVLQVWVKDGGTEAFGAGRLSSPDRAP